jgi:hypothetical protein
VKPPKPELPKLWEVPPLTLEKPRWWTRTKADADKMVAWVNERLEVRRAERANKIIKELYPELLAHGGVVFDPEKGWVSDLYYTDRDLIDLAWQGDVEPLRESLRKAGHPYAELADLIFPPNRGQGGGRHYRNLRAAEAAEDVEYIRRLWKDEYGRWKRSQRGNPPTAVQIAAKFHNVEERSVEKALSRVKV